MNIEATSNTSNQDDIEYEAEYLYHSLFSRKAPDSVIRLYTEAHIDLPELRFEGIKESRQLDTLEVVLSKKLNAVAIEPWLRKGNLRHPLSAKLLLLAYIAESGGQHQEFSRNLNSGWLDLIKTGSSSMFQLLYGLYLKRRYGLV
jgi:hypothetical protein